MMSRKGALKIALVHDELTRRGGAEVVFEELLNIFPQADVYALYAGRPVININDKTYPIRTSFLQRWPLWFRRHPSRLLPFLPQAAEQFDLSEYDVVISSASGFAKAVVTRVNVPQLCYCHCPTRYLWDATHAVLEGRPSWSRWIGKIILHYLRLADFAAAARVDTFLANSRYTKERIASYYRRSSTVIYPPIDTAFFTPAPVINQARAKQAPFLLVGRLTPLKYFDQAIRVCEKLHLPLLIVGQGPEMKHLKKQAAGYTEFLGKVSREQLRDLYRQAAALIQPGVEDFGMASAEALSCGTPVVALGRGGAREVVDHRVTGILYDEPREEALAEALRQFLSMRGVFVRERLQQSVLRFTRTRFEQAMQQQVSQVLPKNG